MVAILRTFGAGRSARVFRSPHDLEVRVPRRTRPLLAAAATVVVAAMLAACGGTAGQGGSPAPDAAPPAPAGATDQFPVTIQHKLGTTTIPAEPKRIIALSYEEDTLGALGITPVAYGSNDYLPGGKYPWLAGKIDLSGSTELKNVFTAPSLEQIAGLKPDLILATNYYGLENYYSQLSQIAPTVGYPEEAGTSSWQVISRMIGRAVGRSAQTEQAIAATEGDISALAARLPGLKGKTFSSSFYYDPGQPFAVIDDPATISVALYTQLGLVLSPTVTSTVKDRSLSMEQIGSLDADFMSIGFATPELRSSLEAAPAYQAIPAVQAGRAYEADAFTAQTFNNPTLLNIPWQLDQITPTLEKVAAGAAG
ncbi:iron-siderophore ABC transporter substrate-binding protein [Pseudonocardia xinjiangensis]|uniref:iron-siderophore ABC transporter substrate-binding protein n=1 Tax=Pseudonocardia xinjiangensis TaxID=75289 RepID=UPI003D8C7FC1